VKAKRPPPQKISVPCEKAEEGGEPRRPAEFVPPIFIPWRTLGRNSDFPEQPPGDEPGPPGTNPSLSKRSIRKIPVRRFSSHPGQGPPRLLPHRRRKFTLARMNFDLRTTVEDTFIAGLGPARRG